MAQKFAWLKLYVVVAVACFTLFIETRLDVPEGVHSVLLIVWMAVAYGMVAFWLNKNPEVVPTAPIPTTVHNGQVEEFFDEDRIALELIYAKSDDFESTQEVEVS